MERVTSSQAKLIGLEGIVLSSAEFEKIFPEWGRAVTSEDYEYGNPLYLVGGDQFSVDRDESVAGYDCETCDGIVLGQPTVNRESLWRGSYNCTRCNNPVYEWKDD